MLHVTEDQAVAIVSMDRPAQRNAMSPDMVEALAETLSRLESSDAVKALVLTGADPGFCAGSDLAALASMNEAEQNTFEANSGRLGRMITQLSKPVVAAVKGFAIGGGLTLAAACDLVVTDASSCWSLPEVPIGLFPAWGLAAVSARVGSFNARRLAWGIETVSGLEAHRLGLVDVIAQGEVLEESVAIARRLAKLPSEQVACVKEYFSPAPTDEMADQRANLLFARAATSPAAQATFERFGRPRRSP
jgi:enoyl-CoA hydratase